jgi:hypothetical protein
MSMYFCKRMLSGGRNKHWDTAFIYLSVSSINAPFWYVACSLPTDELTAAYRGCSMAVWLSEISSCSQSINLIHFSLEEITQSRRQLYKLLLIKLWPKLQVKVVTTGLRLRTLCLRARLPSWKYTYFSHFLFRIFDASVTRYSFTTYTNT